MLNSLSPHQTIQIIRAFSYFSRLANIAEDHTTSAARAPIPWQARRRGGYLGPRPRPGPDAGITPAELRDFFTTPWSARC